MPKRIHIDLLQYVLNHQNRDDNYFNRYFILEDRLANELGYSKKLIAASKVKLVLSGLLNESSHPAPLFITEAGKKFLYENNQFSLLTNIFEKSVAFLNKYKVIISVIGIIVGIYKAAPYIQKILAYLINLF